MDIVHNPTKQALRSLHCGWVAYTTIFHPYNALSHWLIPLTGIALHPMQTARRLSHGTFHHPMHPHHQVCGLCTWFILMNHHHCHRLHILTWNRYHV